MRERNHFVDIMRGIAMLLVVLGHTMQGCTTGAHQSLLYNIIWSLQMPLFILISGYLTRYSHPLASGSDLWKFIKRRTIAYMLPWIVWSLLVRGVILGQHSFLNIKWLLWNMDSGYWFLATIWTINMLFGISVFYTDKTIKTDNMKKRILFFIFFCFGTSILAGLGFFIGLSFFAIKLTLYYIPFFLSGYLFGQYQDDILKTSLGKTIVDFVIAVSLATWIFIIMRYCIFDLQDSGFTVVLRVITSISGCVAVCGLCNSIHANRTITCTERVIHWFGIHSLEVYLTHYLLLNLLTATPPPTIESLRGATLILVNFVLTIVLGAILIQGANSNRLLAFFLFGQFNKHEA